LKELIKIINFSKFESCTAIVHNKAEREEVRREESLNSYFHLAPLFLLTL
jgi:hypothetical protein